MTEVVAEVKSPRVQREAAILELSFEELQALAIKQSRYLSEAKSLLRIAAKKFRWLQKPTDAQDIDKFLDNSK